jgi:small-conductance mechanosensitive channel
MTTSRRARKPAGQRAGKADKSADAGRPTDEMPETASRTDAAPAAPDDPQELEREIEQTREQLGETVELLAAKADVKKRAQVKATELAERVKTKSGQARQQAAARGGSVRGQLAGTTAATRKRVTAAAMPVWEATPEPVRQAVAKGASIARRRQLPLAAGAAAGTLIIGYLAIRWRRRPS